jgi:Tol biopolymer transport system component
MKSLWINLLLIAVFSFAASITVYSQTPEQLYQKGLMKEEGEGALQEAIDLYSQIADNTAADQSLRAKALLHIGLCYERMGTQEAVKAYQRLVDNFPSQKNEVAIARERLNRLIVDDPLAQEDEKKDLLIRKVLPDTEIEPLGGPSPDGRYVSFVDWSSGGNISIIDLETKEIRSLTGFNDPDKQAYYSSWSPDGKQIAFHWWNKDQYNLSVLDVQSAESRDLIVSDKYSWIELGNWSSDSKYIFATLYLREAQKSQIARVSAADGAVEVLKTCEESYTGGKPYVSPDNSYVAFDSPGMDGSGNNDIFLLSLENGNLNALIEHPAHDYFLGWSLDGNNVLFATDRRGTVDAMLIAVKEGKTAGQPKPVKQNIGPIVPMGITKDGSFFYGQWPDADNIFSAEIDIHEGSLQSEPSQMIQRFAGRNYSPAYSSDGKYLAYISGRGVMDKGKPSPVLCIRNLETLEEDEIITDPDIWGGISNPQWSPDNKSIALACNNKDGNSGIYKYDILTREFSILVPEPKYQSSNTYQAYPVWSKDGNSLFYLQFSRYSDTTHLMKCDISSGNEKELYSYSSEDFMDRLFNISLSPDGKWISAINRGENRVIRLISSDGEQIKEIYSFHSPGGFPFTPIWSKDGKYIVFPYQNLESSNFFSRDWGLMRIPSGGGEPLLINLEINIANPTLHPDGRTIAFRSSGNSMAEISIWEMKNFLPSGNSSDNGLAEAPEGIKIRQIWESPALDDLGTVSYDGRFRSCVDWGVGDLAIHDLKSGEIRPLTDKASLGDTSNFVLNTAISKNGKQIVSTWWKPHNTTDLILYDVENSSSNLLYSQQGEELYPTTWLSDHEIIGLRLIPDKRSMQIFSFDIENMALEAKKSFERMQLINLACSPDERFIAYSFSNEEANGKSDINLISAHGDLDIPLITHPANDRVFGWIPGKKQFLFLSDRSGNWDLWAVTLDQTKVKGPAKRIFADLGEVTPMGFTENGECYFGFSRRNFYTSLAPFNAETGEVDIESGESLMGSNYGLTWSPDGKYLAYIKIYDRSINPVEFVVRDLKTGEENKPSDFELFPGAFRWSPDGKSILVFGGEPSKFQTEGYKGDIFLLDMETGNMNNILQLSDYEYNVPEDDSSPLSGLEWSPEGNSFYYMFYKDRLAWHDLETGEDKILIKHPEFTRGVLDLSPDGTRLLFGMKHPGDEKSSLFTIPVKGGEKKEVCTAQEAEGFKMALWSADGKYIYFTERPEGEKTNLWRVTSTGGIPEKVWSSESRVEIFDIHPDGNQIAFSIRERKTEVRMMENLSAEITKVFSNNE